MTRLQRQICAALRAKLAGEIATPPSGSELIWQAFRALSRTRGSSMSGPAPIRYQEIESWCRLTRTPFEPHHVEIITAMDEVWLEITLARAGDPEGMAVLPPKPTQPLTPEMMDLLF